MAVRGAISVVRGWVHFLRRTRRPRHGRRVVANRGVDVRIVALGRHRERALSGDFLGVDWDEEQIDPLIIGADNPDQMNTRDPKPVHSNLSAAVVQDSARSFIPSGHVQRDATDMAGWDKAPRRILHDSGGKIAVDWFRISSVHLVRIVGTDDQRIDLLLIPVDTEEVTAKRALAMATEGHDPDIDAPVGDHSAPVSGSAGPAEEVNPSPDYGDGAPDRHAPAGPGRLIKRRSPPPSLSLRPSGPAD